MLCAHAGEGQGARAAALLSAAAAAGDWLLLSHCHLAPSWLPTLGRLVAALRPEAVHPHFRLWLSTRQGASPTLPRTLLEAAVKIAVEPPVAASVNAVLRAIAAASRKLSGAPAGAGARDDTPPSATVTELAHCLSDFHNAALERQRLGAWNVRTCLRLPLPSPNASFLVPLCASSSLCKSLSALFAVFSVSFSPGSAALPAHASFARVFRLGSLRSVLSLYATLGLKGDAWSRRAAMLSVMATSHTPRACSPRPALLRQRTR
jgi:Dynein heavy chain region D6 P-loop domain